MKKQEPIATQMDEIVFEHRNKNYGAYILRKMYNKQIVRALFLATAVMVAGLAYPLALSYKAIHRVIHIGNDGGTTVILEPPPFSEPPVIPPPPPVSDIQKRLIFIAPVVVADEVNSDTGLPNMDYFNDHTTNVPVNLNLETSVTTQQDMIPVAVEKEEIRTFVEEMPLYFGGDTERMKFLAGNMVYPQQATESGIQGTVYVQFVVDSKGNIINVQVLRGIGGGCDEEAVRVVKMMPSWHPGRQNGQSVPVLFTMPVVFKLQS